MLAAPFLLLISPLLMNPTLAPPLTATRRAYAVALGLSVFTIGYNLAEGAVSTWLGFRDETLALFGFGVDSFIEVISGVGIAYMVLRLRRAGADAGRADAERTALRVTGYGFYALVVGLLVSAAVTVWTGHRPETTVWGVVVSLVSIAVMGLLVRAKERVGRQLNSAAIRADANCTRVCIYMSGVLLVASGVYALTGWPYLDAAGALGLAWFSWKEGRESLENAASGAVCACGHD